jgi:transposase
MKFVATKTADQLDLQALHRVRERFAGQRTGIINQIRAFMWSAESRCGKGCVSCGPSCRASWRRRSDALSPRMLRILEDLSADWRRLDARIEGLSSEIETLARQDEACERLMTVPGIGPIISSAMVAAIGTGDVFSTGRDFGVWLGLVPKQISTGDRTILGEISRRGNRYLRVLFVQAAWVVGQRSAIELDQPELLDRPEILGPIGDLEARQQQSSIFARNAGVAQVLLRSERSGFAA